MFALGPEFWELGLGEFPHVAVIPFDHRQGIGFDAVYPPEREIKLDAKYPGMLGEVAWNSKESDQRHATLDLTKLFAPHKGAVMYAFHEFTEIGMIPGLDNEYWHLATEPYGPEGVYGQWLSYGMVIVPLAWLAFAWLKDRLSGMSPPRPSTV